MKAKRILLIILTVSIIATNFSSVVQASVQTEEYDSSQAIQVNASEDGSAQIASRPSEPTEEFIISSEDDFANFMATPELWESNYKITLACSINMHYAIFEPIKEFSGVFDGCGHTISNFFIEDSCYKNLGIGSAFINILNEYAEIKNVKFNNYNIGGKFDSYKIAMLALTNYGIISCVDIINSGICKIYENANVAGFVITNYGKITKCSTAISVDNREAAGGFVNKNFGVIEECISKGKVYGQSFAGGFVGYNEKGKIYNCSSTGNTMGDEYVGGFCGGNNGEIENSNAKGNAKVTAIIMKSRCGGFVGVNYANIKDCSSARNATGQEYVGGFCGDNKGEIIKSESRGDAKAMTSIMKNRCGGFVGTNDGNIKCCSSIGSAKGQEYIGGFCGDNKGNITNSKSKGDAEIIEDIINTNRCGGFVGCNDEYGEIYGCISTGSAKGQGYIGGFCGDNKGKIAESESKGSAKVIEYIINTNRCGGFVGANYGVVNNCTSTGSATGEEYVGGFAGVNKSEIIDCNADGKATAKTKTHTALAGGFVGENEKGTIISCTATGGADSRSSSGQAKAGGFVGINKASIMSSKASGKVYLSAGTFYKDDGCGGFVGKNDQGGSIDGCYAEATVETTNKKKGGGFVGEAKSKSMIKNSQSKTKIVTKSGAKSNTKFCENKDKKAVIESCTAN